MNNFSHSSIYSKFQSFRTIVHIASYNFWYRNKIFFVPWLDSENQKFLWNNYRFAIERMYFWESWKLRPISGTRKRSFQNLYMEIWGKTCKFFVNFGYFWTFFSKFNSLIYILYPRSKNLHFFVNEIERKNGKLLKSNIFTSCYN